MTELCRKYNRDILHTYHLLKVGDKVTIREECMMTLQCPDCFVIDYMRNLHGKSSIVQGTFISSDNTLNIRLQNIYLGDGMYVWCNFILDKENI